MSHEHRPARRDRPLEDKRIQRGPADRFSLLVFDPDETGHHPEYIRHLLKYASDTGWSRRIALAVPQSLVTDHSEVAEAAGGSESFEVGLSPFHKGHFSAFQDSTSLLARTWHQWQLLRDAIRTVEPDQCLIMYIDHLLLPLALGLDPGCDVSGIYFRPTFHYAGFASYRSSVRDRMRAWRQQVLVRRAIGSPSLRHLFCLDPFAPEVINAMGPNKKAVQLPEPVETLLPSPEKEPQLKRALGIDENRIALLLFGQISERKGPFEVLEACTLLPDQAAKKLSIVVAGVVESQISTRFVEKVAAVRGSTSVQIILEDHYIVSEDVPSYFRICDVVLATYQRHVGSSGVLARSAAAGIPVLASDYGLVGELVRTWRLGEAIDSSSPMAIANALERIIDHGGKVDFDAESADRFMKMNSVEAYGATLLDHLVIGEA